MPDALARGRRSIRSSSDGNIESLPGDYIYLPKSNRAVSVDARGMIEALADIYGAARLVDELIAGRQR